MNVIGISGLSNSVAFKKREFPGLSPREYNIAQGFDAAGALVGPSGVVAAAAEERFTHEKATGAFPVNAIRYCLQAGNLRPQDIDLIAHGFSYETYKSSFETDPYAQRQYQEVFAPEVQRALLTEYFGEANWGDKLVPVPHHLAHAASAFYLSGFPEALILIADGMGEVQSMTVAVGTGTDIKVLKEVSAFHSLGMLYGVFTLYLGFFMNSDEYKVMGLAPYGDSRRFYDQMMRFVSLKGDGTYTLPIFSHNRTALDRETHAGVLRFLAEQFGPARAPEAEITQHHKDLAASLQAVLQTCQLHVLEHFQKETGQKNLCLAGGVALNCSANGLIRRSRLFERMFVQPAAGDDGCSIGAALYAQRLYDPGFKPQRMTVPLWGPEFSDAEIRRQFAGRDDCSLVEMDSFDAVCKEVAERLAKGQIVAWFQGRMEFGPRALGSRSILADPRDPTMRDRINALVKKREAFRPFAPVVTKEAAADIFDISPGDEDTYAHMLYVTPVRPAYRDKLPAITHVDGSARIQTVNWEHNPRLWQLLKGFEALSGVPVLLNTSFNVRGQPIVCTPQEALDTFLFAKLDVLVAGNTLVLPRKTQERASGDGGALGERALPAHCACHQPALEPVVVQPAVLSDTERYKVLVEWNNTRTPTLPNACIHELFEAQARKTPDAVAAVFEEEQLTYRELDRRANQLAHHLQKLKVGPEVLVGICMEVSLEMLVGLLGVLKAGGAYVPLDPDYPKERLGFMIRDARMPVLLTQERLLNFLPELSAQATADQIAKVVCLDSEWPRIEKESPATPVSGATPENLAYVIYTSGSTGKPKGVMVAHRNVANFFTGMDSRIGAEPPGVWLAVTSISFDISVLELFWTLARGFKVVLQRKEERVARTAAPLLPGASRPMDFSLMYFASDESAADGDKYRLLLEGAKFADAHGFTAIWTPERHFHAFGGLYPNPSVTSAAIAATTRRVKIRAGSVVLPLHHPVRVAEEWAVVDNLSQGRVGISFASGWQINDFVLAPDNYPQRKELMLSQLELVRRLWRGETVTMPGANGQEVPVKILPRPVQGDLPVWITASGNPETFRLAGELGVNLLTHLLGQSVAEVSDNIAAYRAAWKAKGHPGEGCVTLMLHTFVGEELEAVRAKVRRPLQNYLRSSIDLIKNAPLAFTAFKTPGNGSATSRDSGPANFTEEELEVMSSHAFDRYFETSGLFGTPELCLQMVERLRESGVDEIACLIDFGVDAESVLGSLELLEQVRDRASQQPTAVCAGGRRATGHADAGGLSDVAAPEDGRTPEAISGGTDDYSLPAQVARHGVTHFQCTPSLASMLATDPEALKALRSLKTVMLGGEALPADLVQHLDLPGTLLNMYGPTETTIWSATHPVDKDQKNIPIGRPIANTEIYIVDERLQPVPVGVPGELLIGGAGVARGYLNRPELTAEKFIPNPFDPGSAARLYRTGDLARYLPDGKIEFLGRIDQQVKLRGFRIELGEIESGLRQHPEVKDCAVALREDAPGDKRLVAYIVPVPGLTPAASSLREFLKPKLPDFMLPSAFVTLPGLPLTPNGKLDRKALPAPNGMPGTSRTGFVPPASATEKKVAEVWREVLGLERVSLQDNFFELGGNSILATQLVSRLRKVFQWELPLQHAFEFPTLQALANALDAANQPGLPSHQGLSRRSNPGEWPLSFAQRRMWFLDQLEPGSHYNDHFHWRLSGRLNLGALERALSEIVRRHETLRSTFALVDGSPVQRILPAQPVSVPMLDLSTLPGAEREQAAISVAVEESRKLFDLESGPLFRPCLLRLGPEEHILLLAFHHIIIDGWSRGVFLQELTALYEAFVAGKPSPLAELGIQYADFAAWQQQWLQGDAIQSQLGYWKQQLQGAPTLLDLPMDRPRPEFQTYRGARLPLGLDKALIDKLTALGHQEGCTLFMVLLAAFQTLLARYSGREHLLVGSPIANRNQAELEGLIGYFLNSLVLRGDLSGDPTFTGLLQRVRKMALEAYTHQDLPFEKLVAELHPERALAYSPVFQVMFILQNPALQPPPIHGVAFKPFEIDLGISKVDLTLSLEESPQGCSGWLEYATDLFDAATILRVSQDYQILLQAIAARPESRLSQLSLPGVPSRQPLASGLAPASAPRPGPGLGSSSNGHGTPVAVMSQTIVRSVNGGGLTATLLGPEFGTSALLAQPATPQTEVEMQLARIWSEVLGVEKVGLHDTIFDLGGHSLLITMIIARMRKAFRADVPIHAFFRTPTLKAIAALVEASLGQAPAMAPRERPTLQKRSQAAVAAQRA